MTAPDPLAPAMLGPIPLRNRVIKAATWEGMAPGGLVSDALIDYHLAVARGGVGMTTVAYLAVAPEGRTELNQITWRPEALPGPHRLAEAVHATGAKISAQIGHAGPITDASSTGLYSLAPSRSFNPLAMRFNRRATKDDIVRITRQHAEAAPMAVDVGFDCIEVHLGHNYFASSFLAPDLNRRKDEYGGSLANRSKVARGLPVQRWRASQGVRSGDALAAPAVRYGPCRSMVPQGLPVDAAVLPGERKALPARSGWPTPPDAIWCSSRSALGL